MNLTECAASPVLTTGPLGPSVTVTREVVLACCHTTSSPKE